MQPPRIPDNENARLQALQLYKVLDTAPEDAFDSITQQAAQYFQVPIALISLVDANRQWFKSCVGLGVSQTGREESFCGYTILSNKPFIIPDALADDRFRDNPLVVGAPFIRFYAGAPLITPEKFAIGTLCLIDTQPRTWNPGYERKLVSLASAVMVKLNLRLANLALQEFAG